MNQQQMMQIIERSYEKYNEKIASIPKIQNILPNPNIDTFAKFNNEDLYEQRYILYIN